MKVVLGCSALVRGDRADTGRRRNTLGAKNGYRRGWAGDSELRRHRWRLLYLCRYKRNLVRSQSSNTNCLICPRTAVQWHSWTLEVRFYAPP